MGCKERAREGRTVSQPVNIGAGNEPVHTWPKLITTKALEPAVSFAALEMMTMTAEEESDLRRYVYIRVPCSGKVLRLKTISLVFWVCQEAQGSGD